METDARLWILLSGPFGWFLLQLRDGSGRDSDWMIEPSFDGGQISRSGRIFHVWHQACRSGAKIDPWGSAEINFRLLTKLLSLRTDERTIMARFCVLHAYVHTNIQCRPIHRDAGWRVAVLKANLCSGLSHQALLPGEDAATSGRLL